MKMPIVLKILLAMTMSGVLQAAPAVSSLPCKLTVTPEIKKAFLGTDTIEVKEITGTATNFQVNGTYRIIGVCRQKTISNAILYVGNTAEAGSNAIVPTAGSSLYITLPDGATQFDCTFTLLRPGILHVTIYDADNHNGHDNSREGIYLGDVVFKH